MGALTRVSAGLWAFALALFAVSGCDGAMQAYFAADVVDVVADIPYVAGSDNPRQSLNLYLPRDVKDFPVVVFVHGGYWTSQDNRYYEPIVGLYGNVGLALARRGIGTAVINYRIVPSVTFEEQMSDVATAVRWVQSNIALHGGNPKRMVLSGHSSGGHVIALAAFDEKRLTAAGVDLSGILGYAPLSPILDLVHMAANPPPSRPAFEAEVVKPVFGTDLTTHSPHTYFKKATKPLLIVMGDKDEPFLVEQLPLRVAELKALGVPVAFHTLADHLHEDIVLSVDTDKDLVTPLLAAFVHGLPY